MILQIIYSLEDGQQLANFPFASELIKTKNNLIQFAKFALLGHHCFVADGWKENAYYEMIEKNNSGMHIPEEIPSLPPKIHKLSLCIIAGEGEKIKSPKWYNECNGKIWFADLNPGEENPY